MANCSAVIVLLALASAASSAQAVTLSYTNTDGGQAPGNKITVTWTNIVSPTTTDWIGFYKAGAPNNSQITWLYTGGSRTGSKVFTIPRGIEPVYNQGGYYQLRLFSANSYLLLAQLQLYVSNTGSGSGVWGISCSPGGSYGMVRWTGIPAPISTDWIGLYRYGTPNNAYLSWTYTTGARAGDVKLWQPAGLPRGWYEVRLFTNGTYILMDVGDTAIC